MATFELYRRSTIGMCLSNTLDTMVGNGFLSPELAYRVLIQFDKSMTRALESQVNSKVSIKERSNGITKPSLRPLGLLILKTKNLSSPLDVDLRDIFTPTDSVTTYGPSS